MNPRSFILLILMSILLSGNNIFSQSFPKSTPSKTNILFVFDASQSMAGTWESDKKINIARNILFGMVDSLQQIEDIEMALRVYGHQSPVPPQDCSDTKLEVPFAPGNASRIKQKLRFITPRGTTPIANSLEKSGQDFPLNCINCRNIIILITDGIEACDGDPCAVSYNLQKMGVILKPFIIGIGIDEGFKETFDCIGQYYNANSEQKFKEVLEIVINQALNSTTAQVNLLDINGLPTETNVNMTFYDRFSGSMKHNYIHTINHRGNPDTLILDPLVTYDVTVHTIPPVKIDSFKVVPGKHTIVAADAPQGNLVVKSRSTNKYRGLEYIVRKAGDMTTLNMQKIEETTQYIVGKYDLEIPVLPRLIIDDVEITQSSLTTVEIPSPGIITFLMAAPGITSVFHMNKGKAEWIYNLNKNVRNESLVLLPGDYIVVYRALNAKEAIYSVTKSFTIKSGSSSAIHLY